MIPWKDYRDARKAAEKAGILSPNLSITQMHHVRPEYIERFKNKQIIDLPEYMEMRMNSYEGLYLTPLYTNAVLIYKTKLAIQNSSPLDGAIPGTYDEVIIHSYAAELCRRLAAYTD